MRSERRRTFSDEHETPDTGDPQVDRCLDELGARLHRESVRLAGRYPATRPQIIAVPATRRSLGNAAWVITLAAAAVIAIAVSPRLRDANRVGQHPGREVVSAASVAAPEPAKAEQGQGVRAPEAVPFSEPLPFPPLVASHAPVSMTESESPVFLLDVSDPELEALLDLWEDERPERTRLSI